MITQQLDQLAEAQAQREVLRLRKEEAVWQVLDKYPEIKAEIAAIELEANEALVRVGENISELETAIKAVVLVSEITVKGSTLMAVWNKPRITWDSRTLDGYAVAHPEILIARKEGEPSVTIRKR